MLDDSYIADTPEMHLLLFTKKLSSATVTFAGTVNLSKLTSNFFVSLV